MIIENITEKIPIKKGWSLDKKYRIRIDSGAFCLLRISPADAHEKVKGQFCRMQAAWRLNIPMCQPLEWGICQEGPYVIQSWIDGRDAEKILPTLPPERQYSYGLDAGRILKQLHTIPAPAEAEPWSQRFNRKIDRKIALYQNCSLQYQGGEAFLRHIEDTRHLLRNRPQCFQHGDYHTGNMMIDNRGTLTIIDFEKWDWGDPWEEFNRIVWCAQLSPAFASGMVDGYFGGYVPMDFWNLLALYICSNTLSSLPWALSFGPREIRVMENQAAEILQWYDRFTTAIPSWYGNF